MAGDTMTQEMICSKARMIYENLKKNVAGQNTAEKLFSKKPTGNHVSANEDFD